MARLPYVIPYDPDFLGGGFRVPLPVPNCRGQLYRGGEPVDYIHFSVVMHRGRQMAVVTAHNIDVSQKRSVPRTDWDLDPRVERSAQTGPEAYANNPWDRGHLVRRAAIAWGDAQRALDASDSSFYYTNSALQHRAFNQDEWVDLEDWVLASAGQVSPRLCVLTGPIYTLHDIYEGIFRVPSAFFKVVVLRDPTANGDDLAALGFVMKQNEMWDDWSGSVLPRLETFQVGLREIGLYTGLDFGELATVDEFEWRSTRFRDRSRMKPVRIQSPDDIDFFGDRRRARGRRALRHLPVDGTPLDLGIPSTPEPAGLQGRCACGGSVSHEPESDAIHRLARATEQLQVLGRVANALLDEQMPQADLEEARAGARLELERVVGGTITAADEYQHCVVVGNEDDWFCSGVLVHPRVVLTAAHCAPDIDRVYVGSRTLSLEGIRGEVLGVESVVMHPNYDGWVVPSHDICVLILEQDATAAEPVPIASTAEVHADEDVTIVGYGYNHPSEPIGFGTRRKVNVNTPNVAGLSDAEREALESLHGYDDAWELYAGRKGLGQDSCNGDSGGPAYVEFEGETRLAALTSRAADSSEARCGDGGIYTRVAPYAAWLHQVTDGRIGEAADADEAAAPAFVYIAAAQPNPAGEDAGREWVELDNPANAAASLTGYTLQDRQGGELALEGAVAAGARRRITIPEGSAVRLANQGDEIALVGPDGATVHRVSYTDAGHGEILSFANPNPEPEAEAPGAELGCCGANLPAETPADADPC